MVLPSSETRTKVEKEGKAGLSGESPIQYQAPLLRRIAQEPDIDLTVFFGSDFSLRSYQDEGFGVECEVGRAAARRISS